MDTLRLVLPVKSVSVNTSHYRNRSLTQEARVVRASVLRTLTTQYADKIQSFKSSFNPKKHYLKVSFTFCREESKFFTQAGSISNMSMDYDNQIKLIQDAIFNARYSKHNWLIERKPREKSLFKGLTYLTNIGIDDRFICTAHIQKRSSTQDWVLVDIQILPLSQLEPLYIEEYQNQT